ncbi:P-type DNA transfer ATPase VirB11 [Cronobacter sakazakii]|nr:P-type DNA transfer ATPase VirB11 [Cronobacter sakazakii]
MSCRIWILAQYTGLNMSNNFDSDKGYMVSIAMASLKSFLDDDSVTEIIINKPGEAYLKTNKGTKKVLLPDLTKSAMDEMLRSVAVYNSTRELTLNYFILPGGERCTVIREPAAFNNYYGFIVRKFMPVTLSLETIREQGGFDNVKNTSFHVLDKELIEKHKHHQDGLRIDELDAELLVLLHEKKYEQFFELAVKGFKNIVISGATNSGKTTFMRAVLEYMDKSERILTIEDVHELKLENFDNKLPLIFGRNEGQISSQELLEACMRATPDRILLAELRGRETWDYLQSLNTGHPGSITSVHAGSAYRAFMRISTLANQSEEARSLGFNAIKETVFSTVDIVVQLKNRKVTEIFFDPLFVLKTLIQN